MFGTANRRGPSAPLTPAAINAADANGDAHAPSAAPMAMGRGTDRALNVSPCNVQIITQAPWLPIVPPPPLLRARVLASQ